LPSQKRFHESAARFKGFSGPIGSGKSQALCQEAIKLSYQNPGRTGLIGAPTYPMLRDATVAALLEALGKNGIPHELNRAENYLVMGDAIMTYVRATYSDARFEVLYPLDVNQTDFNRAINYPASQWTAASLDCLKTEGFGFTLQRNLGKSEQAMQLSGFPAFPATQRGHLVGVGDATTAWVKEAQFAQGRCFESVVLFALDQMCLIGYGLPLPDPFRRSVRMGS